MNIAIIGYGGFGEFLHNSWKTVDGVQIAALADQRFTAKGNDVPRYRDWQDICSLPGIDMVSVATPPSTHVEIALAMMRSGKHVLIEKPVALSLDDVKRLLGTRDECRVVMGCNYMLRFNPLVTWLRSAIQDGIFGRITHVSVENLAQDSSLPPEHWFWDKEVSGGIFLEHAVHFFDLAHFVSNSRAVEVGGLTTLRNSIQEDRVLATVKHENGMTATHYHAFNRPGFFEETTIRFILEAGSIETYGWIPLAGRFRFIVNTESVERLQTLPNMEITSETPISDLSDVSRPAGWGNTGVPENSPQTGGKTSSPDRVVEGTFRLSHDKASVYAQCVRDVLEDFKRAIHQPGHHALIDDGAIIESIRIAEEATRSALRSND